MKYSIGKGIKKGVISGILFAIPIFIAAYPDWANLSIGSALVLLVNFLKVKNTKNK